MQSAVMPKLGLFRESIRLSNISRKQKQYFFKMLGKALQGGVPITKALELLVDDVDGGSFKKIIRKISSDIKQGNSFSKSLESHPHIFSDSYIQMIRVGETGGHIGESCKSISDHLGAEEIMKRKVIDALTYPIFVFILGVAALAIMMGNVLPKLMAVYEDWDKPLPEITRSVLWIQEHVALITVAFCLMTGLLVVLIKKYGSYISYAMFNVSYVGTWIKKMYLAQFSNQLSLLLKNGLPVLAAFNIMKKSTNFKYQEDLEKMRNDLVQGQKLSYAMNGIEWCSGLTTKLVEVGEEAGDVPRILGGVATDSYEDIEYSLKQILKLLGPLFLLIVGGGICFIAIAMVLPVFEMGDFL